MFSKCTRPDDLLLQCRNICFAELGSGGFSTLAASSFALHVAEAGHTVCYTECDVPSEKVWLLYDSVAMDRRFERSGFVDFYSLAEEGMKMHTYSNREKGVNWRLITPDNIKNQVKLTPLQMSRLVFSARADVCIFDLGSCREYDMLLEDMDAVIFFVDPMPSKIVNGYERLSFMQKKFANGFPHIWAVHNADAGISKREIKNMIRDRDICWINEISRREIYIAEYRCRFPWEMGSVRNAFEEFFVSD